MAAVGLPVANASVDDPTWEQEPARVAEPEAQSTPEAPVVDGHSDAGKPASARPAKPAEPVAQAEEFLSSPLDSPAVNDPSEALAATSQAAPDTPQAPGAAQTQPGPLVLPAKPQRPPSPAGLGGGTWGGEGGEGDDDEPVLITTPPAITQTLTATATAPLLDPDPTPPASAASGSADGSPESVAPYGLSPWNPMADLADGMISALACFGWAGYLGVDQLFGADSPPAEPTSTPEATPTPTPTVGAASHQGCGEGTGDRCGLVDEDGVTVRVDAAESGNIGEDKALPEVTVVVTGPDSKVVQPDIAAPYQVPIDRGLVYAIEAPATAGMGDYDRVRDFFAFEITDHDGGLGENMPLVLGVLSSSMDYLDLHAMLVMTTSMRVIFPDSTDPTKVSITAVYFP